MDNTFERRRPTAETKRKEVFSARTKKSPLRNRPSFSSPHRCAQPNDAKIRTSAVAFAKSSIPRPLARFALVSDTALRATIAENRLVSKAPPKPNIIAFSACDDRDDDDDVAATAFDDFLCETTRGICDDAHALVACANMMCAMSTTPSLCTNLCVRDFYARKKQSPFFFFFSSFLSLIYLGFVNFLNPNNDTVNSMSHSFQKGHVGTKSGALLVPPTFVFDDDDTAFFLR